MSKTQQTAGEKPRIGEQEVRRAAELLKKYRQGKVNLERRIIDNEQFWKLRHWPQMEKTGEGGNPGDPQPTSGWLVNCILSKHADAMDCYPEPTVLPREPGDRAEAAKLTRILPAILKKNQFKRTYSSAWWYKLKSGCAVYGVFWDAGKLNGLGDVSIRRMDLLNLFWEPGVTDIQDSANFFSTELVSHEVLEEQYPQLKGKLGGGGVTVSRFLYDDQVDTSDKALVVDWYYHTREKGRRVLQYCKFVGETVLYATENDPELRERGWYDHGKYPFVFDVLFPEEGTPCGYGYVDLCKSPQKQIDLMNQAILKNTLAAATPRFFIRGGERKRVRRLDPALRTYQRQSGGGLHCTYPYGGAGQRVCGHHAEQDRRDEGDGGEPGRGQRRNGLRCDGGHGHAGGGGQAVPEHDR